MSHRRRRFPSPFGRYALADGHDLTEEGADVVGSVRQADPDDLLSATLTLTATADAVAAGGGQTTVAAVKARLAELRQMMAGVSALDYWQAVAQHSHADNPCPHCLGHRAPMPPGKELSARYVKDYDMTPEAADVVAANGRASGDDLLSAGLVLAAHSEAQERAGEKPVTDDAVKEVLAELRLLISGGVAFDPWVAIARFIVSRENSRG